MTSQAERPPQRTGRQRPAQNRAPRAHKLTRDAKRDLAAAQFALDGAFYDWPLPCSARRAGAWRDSWQRLYFNNSARLVVPPAARFDAAATYPRAMGDAARRNRLRPRRASGQARPRRLGQSAWRRGRNYELHRALRHSTRNCRVRARRAAPGWSVGRGPHAAAVRLPR
eukprot:1137138-Pyramimonas_sp.AAC.1